VVVDLSAAGRTEDLHAWLGSSDGGDVRCPEALNAFRHLNALAFAKMKRTTILALLAGVTALAGMEVMVIAAHLKLKAMLTPRDETSHRAKAYKQKAFEWKADEQKPAWGTLFVTDGTPPHYVVSAPGKKTSLSFRWYAI
jgi:hypothetical protein